MSKSKAKKKDEAAKAVNADLWDLDPREALRVGPDFQLASLDRASTPVWSGDEDDAVEYTETITPLLASLQERLFAAAKEGSPKRVLVVAQGLDTAGKGGLARHVIGLVDPQGVRLKAFKAPTAEEREHDFLWRIRNAVPDAGYIGFFDRSQYEDILVPGAAGQLDDGGFDWHVDQIRGFEHELVASGTAVIKVALMVSYEEQGLRLLERLDRTDKHWKYSPGDMDTRGHWFDYQSIYQRMLPATSFDEAPWYVLPADNKWYARLALTEILLRTLADMDVTWPEVSFDVEAERQRVRATLSSAALEGYDAKLASKLTKVDRRIAAVDEAEEALAGSPAAPAAPVTDPAGDAATTPTTAPKGPKAATSPKPIKPAKTAKTAKTARTGKTGKTGKTAKGRTAATSAKTASARASAASGRSRTASTATRSKKGATSE